MVEPSEVGGPRLPPGGPLELPGRGTTFVRHLPARGGEPTLLLLHGWTATADLNWFTAYETLGRDFGVLAIDHRGHGRGIRSRRRFHLRDCADDAIAAAETLGIDRVVAVGYSMGGPIAQLAWKRHPDRVRGLVLCATSRSFNGSQGERMLFGLMPGLAATVRVTPGLVRRRLAQRYLTGRFDDTDLGRWAGAELRRADPVNVMEAGASLGRFDSSEWIGRIDVPVAVVLTARDRAVPPSRQQGLADAIGHARVHVVDADHTAPVTAPRRFVPVLADACRGVTSASPVSA